MSKQDLEAALAMVNKIEFDYKTVKKSGQCTSSHVTVRACGAKRDTDVDRGLATLVTVFVPLGATVPITVISYTNPCMSYCETFRTSIMVPFFILVGLTWIHQWMYDPETRFCSKWMLHNHLAEEALVFFSIATGLSFYNIYVYNLTASFAIVGALFFFVSIMFFTSAFWHKHSLFCNETLEQHSKVMSKRPCGGICCVTYGGIFVFFSVAFTASAILNVALPVFYIDDLHYNVTRNNAWTEEYCVTF